MKTFYCTITLDAGNGKRANVCFRIQAENEENAVGEVASWLGPEAYHALQPIVSENAEPDWKTIALTIDL